jgi:hypothetical protein
MSEADNPQQRFSGRFPDGTKERGVTVSAETVTYLHSNTR